MMILRKHTLPQPVSNMKQLTSNISKSKPRLRSINLLDQNLDYLSQAQELSRLLKVTEKSQNTQKNPSKSNIGQVEQVQKMIIQNKLTLNLTQQTTPSFNQLPSVASFKKMKDLLVSSPLYQKYQAINKEKGEVQSLLAKLERQYDVKAANFRINKPSNKFAKGNRFEIKQATKLTQNRLSLNRQPMRQRPSYTNISRPLKAFNGCLTKVDWRLKDFYEHIEQQSDINHLRIKKVRQRQDIINKLKNINNQCKNLENSRSQIIKSIDTFAKYNENLSQKLSKKHKKIDKINCSQHF